MNIEISITEVARYMKLGTNPLEGELLERVKALIAEAPIDARGMWKAEEEAIYLCGTIGARFDQWQRKLSVLGATDALISQAIGAAAVERVMDSLESDAKTSTPGCWDVRRSPGYGPIPLSVSAEILAKLDATKRIGVACTSDHLLVPTKSVTAVCRSIPRRTWYVLHVKPRTEKRVMEALAALRVFRYLPLLKKVSKVQRRRVVRHLPIFPGYVFTRLFPDERRRILGTQQIVRTIEVPQPRQMIHQLRQIEHASKLPADLKIAQHFEVGEHVKVISGPLRGLEGQVIRRGSEISLVLTVDILGRALETTISPLDLQKL